MKVNRKCSNHHCVDGVVDKKYEEIQSCSECELYADYDTDEEGNILSCCGDILDPDNMMCKTCKEHC